MHKVGSICPMLLKNHITSKIKADSSHMILYSSIVGTARMDVCLSAFVVKILIDCFFVLKVNPGQ